jgi:hypothetical protein
MAITRPPLSTAIDAYKGMSARERLMLLIALASGLYFAAEQLSFQPALQSGQQLALDLSTATGENRALATLLASPAAGGTAPAQAPTSDPGTQEIERLQQQARQLDQLHEEARQNRDIHAWLGQITQGHGAGELASIRVQPALTWGSAGTAAAATPGPAIAPTHTALEWRPVELALEGDYASLMNFLDTLEKRPGVRWVSTDFSVQQHPRSRLSLGLRVAISAEPAPP